MKRLQSSRVTDVEQIQRQILGPQSPKIPLISRSAMSQLREGEVVICTSKPTGVEFLLRCNAWGYVRVRRNPDYFALYVSRPLSRISFFAEVKELVPPEECSLPISMEQASRYKSFGKEKRVIILKAGSLKRLEKEVLKGPLRRLPQGIRYSTLTKLADARTTDDL